MKRGPATTEPAVGSNAHASQMDWTLILLNVVTEFLLWRYFYAYWIESRVTLYLFYKDNFDLFS
jgi:hypothetical protein